MRAEIMKYLKISLFLFVLCLCLPAFSKTNKAYAGAPEVKISVTKVSIVKGGTFTLKVYNTSKAHHVAFSSKDESIATVSKKGVISGIASGTTTIIVTVSEGDKLTGEFYCDVTIGPKPTEIKLTKSELVMCTGSTKHLRFILHPINTVGRPVFYSEDTKVASVSSSGVVRAKDEGKVQITAYINYGTPDEKSALCTVTVLGEDAYNKYLNEKNQAAESSDDTSTEGTETIPTPTPNEVPASERKN